MAEKYIDRAYVQILPDLKTFAAEAKSMVNGALNTVKATVKATADDVNTTMGKIAKEATTQGAKAGENYVKGMDGKWRDGRGKFVSSSIATGLEAGTKGGQSYSTGLGNTLRIGWLQATGFVTAQSKRAALGVGEAGTTAASVFNAGFAKVTTLIQGTIGLIGGVLHKGMLAAGLAAGGILTTALVKGFGRLTAIEDATAKLTGLGNSAASVKIIMDNALASVKGTAFGLDEAATIAASAVAAGVQPGDQLRRTLGLVADTATIAGSSLSDMGAIFNGVASSNKIQGDTIAQLNDRGIPIVQLLAKTMKITSSQVTDLASKGKIDFKTFQTAIESGLGGAALKSGGTTTGALKNVNAALGRLGASMLSGLFPIAKSVLGSVTKLLDDITSAVKPVAAAFSGELVSGLTKAGAVISGLFSLFSGGGGGGLAKALGVDEGSGIIKGLSALRDAAVPVFDAIMNAIKALPGMVSDLQSAFGPLIKQLGTGAFIGLVLVFRMLAPVINLVVSVAKGITSWLSSNGPLVRTLAVGILAVVAAIKVWTIVTRIWSAVTMAAALAIRAVNIALATNPIVLVVLLIIGLVAAIIYAYKNFSTFRNIVNAVFATIRDVVMGVFNWIKSNWPLLLAIITGPIGLAVYLVVKYWTQIRDFTMGVVNGVINFVRDHWKLLVVIVGGPVLWIVALIVKNWDKILGATKAVWNAIMDAVHLVTEGVLLIFRNWTTILIAIILGPIGLIIKGFMMFKDQIFAVGKAILDWFKALPGRLISLFTTAATWLVNAGKNTITGLWNGYIAVWKFIIDWFLKIIQATIAFFVAAPGWLINAGKQVLSGLWNGLKAIWLQLYAWWLAIIKGIISFFVAAPTWLVEAGKNVISGLWEGMKTGWRVVAAWVGSIAGATIRALGKPIEWLASAGADILTGLWNGLKKVWDDVKDWFAKLPGKILGYLGIKSPPKWAIEAGKWMMKGLLRGLGHGATNVKAFMMNLTKDLSGVTGIALPPGLSFDASGVAKLGGGIGDFLTGLENPTGDLTKFLGTTVGQWAAQAAKLTGVGASWIPALVRRALYESGGDPRAINLTDQNAKDGHPSMGLMQTIRGTFDAYAGAGKDIWNPVDNMVAAINYIKSRYGSIFSIDPPVSGYAVGSWELPGNQIAAVHKGEMILPAALAGAVRGALSKSGSGTLDEVALAAAIAAAFSGLTLQFDSDGLARIVTKSQNATNLKGPRR